MIFDDNNDPRFGFRDVAIDSLKIEKIIFLENQTPNGGSAYPHLTAIAITVNNKGMIKWNWGHMSLHSSGGGSLAYQNFRKHLSQFCKQFPLNTAYDKIEFSSNRNPETLNEILNIINNPSLTRGKI